MNGWAIAGLVLLCAVVLLLLIWGISYGVWTYQRGTIDRTSLKGLVPVPPPSLAEYLGKWYEHRRINSWFEPPDFSHVTAEYGSTDNPRVITVTNTGVDAAERAQVSRGTASLTNVEGVLDVSFFPPFSGLYVILGYQPNWAIVGSPSRELLWLLGRSRDPVSAETESWFRSVAIANGYSGNPNDGIKGVVHVDQS